MNDENDTVQIRLSRQHWWCVITVAVLVVGLVVFAWFYDEEPPQDADLMTTLPVPLKDDPDNGFPLFMEAAKAAKIWPDRPEFPEDDVEDIYNNLEKMDMVKARALWELNESAWQLFERAWAKPKMFNPEDPLKLPELSTYLVYSRLAVLRTNLLLRENKIDEAVALQVRTLENLRRLRDPTGREVLVVWFTHNANLAITYAVIGEMWRYLKTRAQCEQLMAALEKDEAFFSASRLQTALRLEYMFVRKQMVNDAALLRRDYQGRFPSRFSFKSNRELRKVTEAVRWAIAYMEADTFEPLPTLPDPPPSFFSKLSQFIWEWRVWKIIGVKKNQSVWTPISNPARLRELYGRMAWADGALPGLTRMRLLQAALAMRAYALEHDGKLPVSLETLVPEYLPAVPVDPFSAAKAPLRYDPAQRLIWSIGSDAVDEGGKPSQESKLGTSEEPRFQMPESL